MAITLETLENDELGPDSDVYVDVADYSDAVLVLKQDGQWVALDQRQQQKLLQFLTKRLQ